MVSFFSAQSFDITQCISHHICLLHLILGLSELVGCVEIPGVTWLCVREGEIVRNSEKERLLLVIFAVMND